MTTRPRISLRREKNGLMKGVSVKYYEWKWRNVLPEDIRGLNPILETISPRLSLSWIDRPDERIRGDRFLVAIEGFMRIDIDGSYRFIVKALGGIKLQIGRSLIADSQIPGYKVVESSDIYLSKGYTRFKLLYGSLIRQGDVRIEWRKPIGITEEIPEDILYFTIGNHVFFTNLPNGTRVTLIPVREEVGIKECLSINEICIIELSEFEQPFECLITVYGDEARPLYRSTQPILLWGGDVYRFQLGE